MDLGRSAGKYPPIPSRGSIEGGGGSRQPIPYPPHSELNSGRGTPTRDPPDNSPPTESKGRPEPDRSTPSLSRSTPAPFSTSSNTSLRTKCIPSSPREPCVPAHLVDLYRRPGTQGYDEVDTSSHPEFRRQSTFTERDVYAHSQQEYPQQSVLGQQTEYTIMAEKKSQESKSQRQAQKCQTTQQHKTTTKRPDWKITSRSACKAPSIYPEPLKPLPPVQKSTVPAPPVRLIETKPEYQISAKQSQISARHSQIGVKHKQGRPSPVSAKSSRQWLGSADLQQSNQTRRGSQLSNTSTVLSVSRHDALSDAHSSTRFRRPDDAGPFHADVHDHFLTGVPLRRSSERVNVEQAASLVRQESQTTQSALGPIHFVDKNLRLDAENVVCARERSVPRQASSERLREECVNLMQKLTAELDFAKDLPASEKLCVRLSLGEQLTSDGRKRSFTICEPGCRVSVEQAQEECQEIYATPSASSPRDSVPTGTAKSRISIREPIVEDSSDHDSRSTVLEAEQQSPRQDEPLPPKVAGSIPELPTAEKDSDPQVVLPLPPRGDDLLPPNVPLHPEPELVLPPQESTRLSQESLPQKQVTPMSPRPETPLSTQERPVRPSVHEILPPVTLQSSVPHFEDIYSPYISTPRRSETTPPPPAQYVRTPPTEPEAKPGGSQRDKQVPLDRESSTGIKMKPVENEALNTEFLYYSSVLKTLLPVLSCPEDRCRLVPWVKKLFSPEYCARLLRDKRNRFLLHLVVVLCNDEVIGVFRNPPPEGIIPSVDELCSTRYPPAAWECDSAWLDHLEDIPPGATPMPCPWHTSGCPPTTDQFTASTSSERNSCPETCYPWRQYGTSSEVSLGWSLDQEFKLLLNLSRPLKPLMKVAKDRQRMVSWHRFLCTVTPDCCVALRALRNDYMKLLLAYGQDDRMTGPFASDPVWGQPLPPLGDLGDGGDRGQAKPFADPASGDVDEFLRSVPVPNEGAFCYVAVDGVPVTPITRPSASVSLLRR